MATDTLSGRECLTQELRLGAQIKIQIPPFFSDRYLNQNKELKFACHIKIKPFSQVGLPIDVEERKRQIPWVLRPYI